MRLITSFLKNNIIVLVYAILAFLIELMGVAFTDKVFYIKDPRYILTILASTSIILFLVTNKKAKTIVASLFVLSQALMNTFFLILFEMNGQYFDFSMFDLRNEAMGIMENLPVNFWFCFIIGIAVALFIVYGIRGAKAYKPEGLKTVHRVIFNATLICFIFIFLGFNVATAKGLNNENRDIYEELLTSTSNSKYKQYGITSNFVNEMYKGLLFNDIELLPESEIYNSLTKEIAEPSEYFGTAKGKNVITILGETFEWFAFIKNLERYPNGHFLDEADLEELYPNFYKLFNSSVVFSNYNAHEKTDISENYSIIGSYPLDEYTNYAYYKNTLSQSLPNVMKEFYGPNNIQTAYYHNGTSNFYNRSKYMPTLGFDNVKFFEDMDLGENTGERPLDSLMMETNKNEMFPTDKKFNTYITTITMHGMYSAKRKNLEQYYTLLEEKGIYYDKPDSKNNNEIKKEDKIFATYLAAAMDVDRAIGIMFEYLETNNLIDDTVIVMFGDHRGYYEGLSEYVRDIESIDDATSRGRDYTELFNVPLMIMDTDLVESYKEKNGTNINTRFSGSADIVPTILDLLGIRYYSNVYYGSNLFSNDDGNVIYSRGYGEFLYDDVYFINANNVKFIKSDKVNDDEYFTKYITKARDLVIKIKYMDQAYRTDFFKSSQTYSNSFKDINKLYKKKISDSRRLQNIFLKDLL
ncbi:MAG: LTA synthase family protein [Anaeroplasmataceae bacterium]